MPLLLRLCIVLFLCITASACAARNKPLDAEAARQVYLEANHDLQTGDYEAAMHGYQKLVQRDAPAPFDEQAFIELAYAYYKKRDYAAVNRIVGDFLQRYPEHPRADYMYYLRATASVKMALSLNEANVARRTPALTEAYGYFQELSEQFPNNDYKESVLRDVLVVRQQLASIKLEQARAALRRGDLAGLALARRVDDEFHETPAAREALALISDPEAIKHKPPTVAMTPSPAQLPVKEKTPLLPQAGANTAPTNGNVPEPRIPIHDAHWILQQNPERYTIELLASASTETAQQFVDTHNIHGSARYPVNESEAHDTLIHGLYPNAESARTAAQQLMKLWGLREAPVRRIAEVQKKLHSETAPQ